MFITFEGIEGSGKSTQSKKLQQFLLSKGISTILTREPGGTETGEKIREILINQKLTAETEIMLNFAARIEHIENLIKPALHEKKIVISDRFLDSTYAYQGFGFGFDLKIIKNLADIFFANFSPDITFLIDLEVEKSFDRLKKRAENNKYEKFSFDFHQKVRTGFLELAAQNQKIHIINGDKNEEEIFSQIIAVISQKLSIF
jgi:dTMP kinase